MPPSRPASSRSRRVLHLLGARNPAVARYWAALALVASIGTCLAADVLTTGALHGGVALAALGLSALAVVLVRLPVERVAPLVPLAPLVGTASILWLDLATRDAGITGQVFFCLPVIWAASQLRPLGSALVAVVTIAAEAVVVLTLLPLEEALVDLAYLATLLLLLGGVLTRSGVVQDRLVARLELLATIDPLTGLVTRRALDAATAFAVSVPGGVTSLVLVDLDRFKTVNDTHGHLAGDAALVHVARVVSAGCRDVDVVARMGGDELAVLMPGCPPEAAAQRATDFVRAVRETPVVLETGERVSVSVSAGLASAPQDATTARGLYAGADSALYRAKNAGRGRLSRLHDPVAPAL